MSSRGFQEQRAPAPLNRSSSDQMLLRKRGDEWQYMEPPTSVRPTSRDRKARSNAHDTHYMPSPPPPRHRAATAVLPRLGNDQGGSANGGAFRLNRKEKQFLIKRAKESSLALIDHAHTLDGPIQWHYKGKHRGIQMYRGEGVLENGVPNSAMLGSDQALEYLCGVTTMIGTLEEVSEYFDQATTARMKMTKAKDVLDCAVLYSLVWGNTVNPFHRVSVKYTAYEGPAAMTRPRDFCYLECQDTFRHSTGRRGWVLSMHSIKIPSCPEVPGFVRGSVYHSGLVFVEAERPGYMDVMYSLQINFKDHGRVPQFMLNSALKRRLRELIHISREIQMARIAHRTLLGEKDLVPKNLRTTCVNCSRRFWLLLRKTRCRVCGEVVCQACAPIVDYEGAGSNGQHSKTRICVKCYTTSPTTGSWTAPNESQPWTEQSRIMEVEKKKSMQELPSHRKMQKLDEGDEEEEDDEEEDVEEDGGEGRFTFAELEVQSSHSVFAPERFTRSSIASIAPLPVDEIHEYDNADDNSSLHSDDYTWQQHRITNDSEFDPMGGSVTSSVLSRDSYFGRPEPPSMRFSMRRPAPYQSVNEDTPMLLEEPEQPSPCETVLPSPTAAAAAPAPSTQPPLHPNTQRGSSESKSSYEFLDGLLDVPIARQHSGESRKRAQTTVRKQGGGVRSELNPTTLHAHNLRYMRSPAPPPSPPLQPEVTVADLEPELTTAPAPSATPSPSPPPSAPAPRVDVPVSLDDLVLSSSNPSTNDSFDGRASVDTNSLFSRPSSLILQQVRKNRSKTIQLQTQREEQFRSTKDIEDRAEDHRRRMAELNQKAIEYTGHRVSTLEITRPSLEPEPVDDEVWLSSTLMEEYRSKRKHTIEALRKKAMSIQEDGRASTETDRTTGSSRSPSWTSVRKISESGPEPPPSLSMSSRIMADVHLRHSLARSPSLLAPKMSETGSQSPLFGGKKLWRPPSEVVSPRGTLDDLSFKPLDDRPRATKPQFSVQAEGAEDDDDTDNQEETTESPRAGHQLPWEPEPEATNYDVSPRQRRQEEQHDFVSARSLYAEIGMLSKLNSQVAVAENKNEVDRIKDRIQEQYQIIRGLQLKP